MSEAKSKITLMSLWPPIVSFFRLKSAPLRATNNFIEPFFTCWEVKFYISSSAAFLQGRSCVTDCTIVFRTSCGVVNYTDCMDVCPVGGALCQNILYGYYMCGHQTHCASNRNTLNCPTWGSLQEGSFPWDKWLK